MAHQLLSLLLLLFSLLPFTLLAKAPNIVFVIADDLGWADVAFHGGSAPTPHLDKLAKKSLELTQHYVAPVCSPTRVGLLTGRCWSRFGITTPINTQALPRNTVTLPQALKSAGYETCLIGKWHLGSKPEWGPNHYGFDHSYGSLAGGVTAWSHLYKKGAFSITWHRNHTLIEEEGHVTDLLTDEAVKWIGERKDKPFFLYVPYTAVHLPVNEPNEWLDQVPASMKTPIARHYAACIMHLDHSVGRILEALEKKGVRNNTLFIFTSDNGGSTATNNTQPYPKDDSPSGRIPASNHPFRGQKGQVYEGGIRVPTLVSWPGSIPVGKDPTPTFIADWMPTFLSLAKYKTKKDLKLDGTDLSEQILKLANIPERPIYIAGIRRKSNVLRKGDWKLIAAGNSEKPKLELYNIPQDSSEANNLAKEHPDLVKELLSDLKKLQQSDNDSVVSNPR